MRACPQKSILAEFGISLFGEFGRESSGFFGVFFSLGVGSRLDPGGLVWEVGGFLDLTFGGIVASLSGTG